MPFITYVSFPFPFAVEAADQGVPVSEICKEKVAATLPMFCTGNVQMLTWSWWTHSEYSQLPMNCQYLNPPITKHSIVSSEQVNYVEKPGPPALSPTRLFKDSFVGVFFIEPGLKCWSPCNPIIKDNRCVTW